MSTILSFGLSAVLLWTSWLCFFPCGSSCIKLSVHFSADFCAKAKKKKITPKPHQTCTMPFSVILIFKILVWLVYLRHYFCCKHSVKPQDHWSCLHVEEGHRNQLRKGFGGTSGGCWVLPSFNHRCAWWNLIKFDIRLKIWLCLKCFNPWGGESSEGRATLDLQHLHGLLLSSL